MEIISINDIVSNNENPEEVFELLDVLGEGSYGSVYKALNKATGEIFAVKVVNTAGEIASLKRSDYVVQYFGSYYRNNYLWLTMEYCAAGSVIDLIKITKRSLNENEIASILYFTLKGLEYLHENKMIHRDIKAGNILLDHRGNAKLADFGVSAQLMHTLADKDTVIGTPFWMSPEVISRSKYNKKTDIWSLGITTIELCEGEPPYSHIHPIRAMFVIKSNPPQGFTHPGKWSTELNQFLKRCLTLNPKERPTAKELLQDPFILKKNKGRGILSEMVMDSIDAIERYRIQQAHKNKETINKNTLNMFIMNDSAEKENNYLANDNGTMREYLTIKENNYVNTFTNDTGTLIFHKSDSGEENSPKMTGTMIVKDDIVDNQNEKAFVQHAKKEVQELEELKNAAMAYKKKSVPRELEGMTIEMLETKIQKLMADKETEIKMINARYQEKIDQCLLTLQILKNQNSEACKPVKKEEENDYISPKVPLGNNKKAGVPPKQFVNNMNNPMNYNNNNNFNKNVNNPNMNNIPQSFNNNNFNKNMYSNNYNNPQNINNFNNSNSNSNSNVKHTEINLLAKANSNKNLENSNYIQLSVKDIENDNIPYKFVTNNNNNNNNNNNSNNYNSSNLNNLKMKNPGVNENTKNLKFSNSTSNLNSNHSNFVKNLANKNNANYNFQPFAKKK